MLLACLKAFESGSNVNVQVLALADEPRGWRRRGDLFWQLVISHLLEKLSEHLFSPSGLAGIGPGREARLGGGGDGGHGASFPSGGHLGLALVLFKNRAKKSRIGRGWLGCLAGLEDMNGLDGRAQSPRI